MRRKIVTKKKLLPEPIVPPPPPKYGSVTLVGKGPGTELARQLQTLGINLESSEVQYILIGMNRAGPDIDQDLRRQFLETLSEALSPSQLSIPDLNDQYDQAVQSYREKI